MTLLQFTRHVESQAIKKIVRRDNLSRAQSKKVYVIDEVDRSLHTLLIRRLLEGYLAKCSRNSRSQLLFTTHNVLLMD